MLLAEAPLIQLCNIGYSKASVGLNESGVQILTGSAGWGVLLAEIPLVKLCDFGYSKVAVVQAWEN